MLSHTSLPPFQSVPILSILFIMPNQLHSEGGFTHATYMLSFSYINLFYVKFLILILYIFVGRRGVLLSPYSFPISRDVGVATAIRSLWALQNGNISTPSS